MNANFSKTRLIEIANVYIQNGELIKYRFLSDDENSPDFILGRLKLPIKISKLDNNYKSRVLDMKDRLILENETGISFIGFDEDLLRKLIVFQN